MAKATSEVLSGPGELFTAADLTAAPANPDTAPAGAWSSIGYTDDGVTLVLDKNFEEIRVAEETDPIDVRKTSQVGRLRANAAQASLEIIQEAMAGGTIGTEVGPPALKTYTPPAADEVTKKADLFRTAAPTVGGAARKRDIYATSTMCTGGIEADHKPAPDKTLIALDYQMLKVTGQNLFKIVDRTT